MPWRFRLALVAISLSGCSGPAGSGFEPYMPPPAENPCVDSVYLQEFNHTGNELEPGIRAHVDAVIGGIVDNGFQLLDIDGEVTKHGQFDPHYVNEDVAGAYGDGGRRSVQILAALNLAHYMTGKQKYLDAKRYLIEEHHYDQNVIHESEYEFRKGSGDGDELGTQAFFVLLRYEPDPNLREKWIQGWRRRT
jgi:hypothetical protein